MEAMLGFPGVSELVAFLPSKPPERMAKLRYKNGNALLTTAEIKELVVDLALHMTANFVPTIVCRSSFPCIDCGEWALNGACFVWRSSSSHHLLIA